MEGFFCYTRQWMLDIKCTQKSMQIFLWIETNERSKVCFFTEKSGNITSIWLHPIDQYMISTIYLKIGITNYFYKHILPQAQAACKGYTKSHFDMERVYIEAYVDMETSKNNKKSFRIILHNIWNIFKYKLWDICKGIMINSALLIL